MKSILLFPNDQHRSFHHNTMKNSTKFQKYSENSKNSKIQAQVFLIANAALNQIIPLQKLLATIRTISLIICILFSGLN